MVSAGGGTGTELAPPPPRALIFTVLGLYVREAGGWISVRALIRVLGAAGVDAQAVRSSVSRLKRRGLIESARRAGLAGYTLSDLGREVLAVGDQRIFARDAGRELERWAVVVFSVPERERHRRHVLRTRLAERGFGTVASGVWIAPVHLLDDARGVIEEHGLERYVDIFAAEYLAFGEPAAKVAQWWDLEALDHRYRAFLRHTAPVLHRWQAARQPDPQACFADYLHVLTAWRRLPYLDPGLPRDLLPAHWSGHEARETFFALQRLLQAPARDFVTAQLD